MADEALLNTGTELILEATGDSGTVSDDAYYECNGDDRQVGDNTGYTLGLFEIDVTDFTAAPTAGAAIHIYEQKINSDGTDAPDVDSDYPHGWLGAVPVDIVDGSQSLPPKLLPINRFGGKYWIRWKDGTDSSPATLNAGWEMRLTPCAFGT